MKNCGTVVPLGRMQNCGIFIIYAKFYISIRCGQVYYGFVGNNFPYDNRTFDIAIDETCASFANRSIVTGLSWRRPYANELTGDCIKLKVASLFD